MQMVGAARELCEMVQGLDSDQLREYCAERSIHWIFTTPAAPNQNGCAEALVKVPITPKNVFDFKKKLV